MWRLAERAKRLLNGKITENTPVSFFKLTGVFLGVGVGQHKGQLGGGGALAVHPRRGFAHAHRAVLLYQFTVQGEHIAGGDLFAEAGILDAAEEGQFSGRLSAATAPVWASASRMSTPGITG